MEYVQSILLGIVQGIAEFLPISSSGHLVLGEELLGHLFEDSALDLGAADSNLVLNVALHVGTLASIVLIYWTELWRLLRSPRQVAAIAVATIPAAAVGLLFKERLEAVFGSTLMVGSALCVTAALLWMSRRFDHGATPLPDIGLAQAFVIGLFQAVALIPGISRSGSTIVGGLWTGLDRESAATFSFLIAVPAIGGAAALELKDLLTEGTATQTQWLSYAAGALTAFLVGVMALRWLLGLISRRKLHHFAWYCLALGLFTVVLSLNP